MLWGISIVCSSLALLIGWAIWTNYVASPYGGEFREVVVMIPHGTSGQGVADILAREHLLRRPEWFPLFPLLEDVDPGSFKAGEYRFTSDMSPLELFHRIGGGKVVSRNVTIPEGTDLFELQALLAATPTLKAADLNAALWTGRFPAVLDLDLPSAEGVLFPDSYTFSRGTSALTIVERMAETFVARWERLTADAPTLLEEFPPETIITIASLVEKEARVPEERGTIAGVYYNRLRRGMRLQADPTVAYAAKLEGLWDGVFHRSDLDREHPYNTYTIAGVPPGPICAVGAASLEAALNPEATDYLFFVARNDGTHVFSETYAQHRRAVQKYQR